MHILGRNCSNISNLFASKGTARYDFICFIIDGAIVDETNINFVFFNENSQFLLHIMILY